MVIFCACSSLNDLWWTEETTQGARGGPAIAVCGTAAKVSVAFLSTGNLSWWQLGFPLSCWQLFPLSCCHWLGIFKSFSRAAWLTGFHHAAEVLCCCYFPLCFTDFCHISVIVVLMISPLLSISYPLNFFLYNCISTVIILEMSLMKTLNIIIIIPKTVQNTENVIPIP